MSRTATARRPRARAVLLAAVLAATATGLSPLTTAVAAPGAPVPGIDQLDVDPDWRALPRGEVVTAVSATGYAHATEDDDTGNDDPLVWTDFATGASAPLGTAFPFLFARSGVGGRYAVAEARDGQLTVRDLTNGATRPFTEPSGSSYTALLGDRVLFRRSTGLALAPATAPDGPATAVTGWPADADPATARPVAGDATRAIVRYGPSGAAGGSAGLGLVDLATGRLTPLDGAAVRDGGDPSSPVALDGTTLAWVDPLRTVHLRDLADPSRPDRTFALPAALDESGALGVVGGWVLALGGATGTDAALHRSLVALHPDRPAVTLLEKAESRINQLPGGGAAVVGGTGATDWALLKAVPGKDGTPLLEKLAPPVAPVPAAVESLALGAGRLSTLEHGGARGRAFAERTLPVGPTHTGQSKPVPLGAEPARLDDSAPLYDSGDGRTVHLAHDDFKPLEIVARTAAGRVTRISTGENHGGIADVFGRWTVFQSASRTLVVDLDAPAGTDPVRKRTRTAAAVWGDTLYTGTAVNGEVARTDLVTGKDLGRLTTGAPCPATEYQLAGGRWLYWACASQHGVYDLQRKQAVPLGAKAAPGGLLGDGYYVDREPGGFLLRVTDFHTGRATTGHLDPTAPVTGARRQAWTVDRFGGAVAYRGADRRVHVVWPGVPASDLTAASAKAPASARFQDGWKASWALSKPVSFWRLTVRDPYTQAVVRTFGGDEARGRIDVTWDGRTAAGEPLPNGPYDWELRANTADGAGRDLTASGAVALTGGRPAWRDLAGNDRQGDLLVRDPRGLVSLYRGNGYGGLSGRTAGTGGAFPTSSVLVPFGDVNGDGCADVLARVGDQLRAYRPGCGAVVSASSPYTPVGAGWGQYDVLTSPGDANGDGHPDLVARQKSTGDVYFYAGTADHRMRPRVRIGVNWKLYTKIVGAGDLNGDGRGDLLGVDAAGVLWRYYGTAAGGVTARVRLGAGWSPYTSLVGTGDLSGDGCADLVARDTTGKLYAYSGTCRGTYTGRVLLGGGWNAFPSLF